MYQVYINSMCEELSQLIDNISHGKVCLCCKQEVTTPLDNKKGNDKEIKTLQFCQKRMKFI